MSVPKTKQRLSDLQFYRTALWLRKTIVFYLLRDFGIRDKIRKVGFFRKTVDVTEEDRAVIQQLADKYDLTNPLIEEYPMWYLEDERTCITGLLRSLVHNIRRANKIYPTTVAEFDQRRAYQNNAIGDCEVLLAEFQHLIEVLPIDINKYEETVEKIDTEVELLKGWKKADNRLLKGILKRISPQQTVSKEDGERDVF